MKRLLIAFYLFTSSYILYGQAITQSDSIADRKVENLTFSKRQLLIPGIFLTYGIASIESDYLQLINTNIRDKLKENIDEKFSIDDFSVFIPALSVYGLNLASIKGRNSFKDRSLVLGASALIMTTTVLTLKSLTHITRPDESTENSFPSGHTATAYAGAEFLYQEYKDVSPWIGIAGYAVATGTGFFRLYNQRHWLSDVMMGAGIGILSTKIAYWTFPYYGIKNGKVQKNISSMIIPFYDGKLTGASLVINIR